MYNFSFFCAAALLLLSACGGSSSDLTKRIPENSVAVGTFNTAALFKKSNFERFRQTEQYKKAMGNTPEVARKYLLDPTETGFDLGATIAFYVQVLSAATGDINVVTMLPIKDVAKVDIFFETINAKKNFSTPTDKKGYKLSMNTKDGDDVFVAWDKKVFAIGFIKGLKNNPEKELYLDKIFKPEGKNINNNADFAKHFKQNKDVMIWASTDDFFKELLASEEGVAIKMGLGFFGLKETALQGNSITAFHDFQNGKMESVADFTFSKELKDEFGSIFKDKSSQSFEKYLPAA